MFDLNSFLQNLQLIAKEYEFWGPFLATFIEEIISPIPSELTLFFIGYIYFFEQSFSILSILQLIFVISILASLGVTIGAIPFYYLSYVFGESFIKKFGKLITLRWQDLEKINQFLNKNKRETIILLLLRIIPIVPSIAINVFFGLLKFHWLPFVTLSFFGNWIRAIILIFLGWQLSFYFEEISIIFQKLSILSWIIFVIGVFLIFYYAKKKNNSFLLGKIKKSFQKIRHKLR